MKLSVLSTVFVPLVAAAATPTQNITTTAAPAVPSPVQSRIAKNCVTYHRARSSDSCATIVRDYGLFSFADFYLWNPDVGWHCDRLLKGHYYCVGVPGTPSKCTEKHPVPTQSGGACQCGQWYMVKKGDNCQAVEEQFSISHEDFRELNPGVNGNCTNLNVGINFCVKAKES